MEQQDETSMGGGAAPGDASAAPSGAAAVGEWAQIELAEKGKLFG